MPHKVTPMKRAYTSPTLTRFGTVATLTAAIGQGSRADQSEFPEEFPPSTGSYDVCYNEDENDIC